MPRTLSCSSCLIVSRSARMRSVLSELTGLRAILTTAISTLSSSTRCLLTCTSAAPTAEELTVVCDSERVPRAAKRSIASRRAAEASPQPSSIAAAPSRAGGDDSSTCTAAGALQAAACRPGPPARRRPAPNPVRRCLPKTSPRRQTTHLPRRRPSAPRPERRGAPARRAAATGGAPCHCASLRGRAAAGWLVLPWQPQLSGPQPAMQRGGRALVGSAGSLERAGRPRRSDCGSDLQEPRRTVDGATSLASAHAARPSAGLHQIGQVVAVWSTPISHTPLAARLARNPALLARVAPASLGTAVPSLCAARAPDRALLPQLVLVAYPAALARGTSLCPAMREEWARRARLVALALLLPPEPHTACTALPTQTGPSDIPQAGPGRHLSATRQSGTTGHEE